MRSPLRSRPRNAQTFAVVLVLLAGLVIAVVNALRAPSAGPWLLVALLALVLGAASWWLVSVIRQGRRPDAPDSAPGRS